MLAYGDLRPPSGKGLAALFVGIAVGLLVIEIAAGVGIEPGKGDVFENCYRVTETATTMAPFIKHVAAQKAAGKTVVVVIGSSPAQGSASAANETISCYLQKLLPGISVYNLAKSGNMITDDYLVLSSVAPYADVVIVDGMYDNYFWFSTRPKGAVLANYPEFAFLPNVADADTEGMGIPPHSSKALEYAADDLAAKASALYRNRQLIQEALLGESPKDLPARLARWLLCATLGRCEAPRFPPFLELDASTRRKILLSPELLREPLHDESAPAVRYMEKMSSKGGRKMLVYMNPINPLVQLEGTNYTANTDLVRNAALFGGARFFDLTRGFGIEANDFADNVHLIASGNRKIAAALYPEVLAMLPNAAGDLASDPSQPGYAGIK